MNLWNHMFAVTSVAGILYGGNVHASAAVIQSDHPTFGADAVVRDTLNGRDFLRLDFTTPYTYDEVLAQLAGLFLGWGVASTADLEALGVAAGITHESTDPLQIALAEQLRDWFCFTCEQTSSTHIYARGLVSDVTTIDIGAGPVDVQEAFSIGRRLNVTPNEVDFRISGWYYTDAKSSPDEGIFLTRRSIPDLSHGWDIVLAGVAIGLVSRWRNAKLFPG
jgi:hypothetical protein